MDDTGAVLSPADVTRLFLASGLAKFGNVGAAQDFLAKIDNEVRKSVGECGLPVEAAQLAERLSGVEAVKDFVDCCSDEIVSRLSWILDFYRGGGVQGRIARYQKWTILRQVPVERILLSPSEFWLHALFFRNGHSLSAIVADKQLWEAQPYSSWTLGRRVDWPLCLAEKMPEDMVRIIDGTHRAIQMVWNGAKALDLCCSTSVKLGR